MTRALDRVICGVYREVPSSAAVTCLLAPCEVPELPGTAPGAAHHPRREASFVTRHARKVKRHWGAGMKFPSPGMAVLLALWVGGYFTFAGEQRFSTPGYAVFRAAGGETLWGLGFLAVATCLLLTWRWFHRGLLSAYTIAAIGYLMLALTYAEAAWSHPDVQYFAVGIFLWLAWAHYRAAARVPAPRIERWMRDRRRK